MVKIIRVTGLALLCCAAAGSALDKTVTFDAHAAGTYTESMASGDFSANSWNNGLDEGRATIVDGADAYSGKSLRITYKGGRYGPSDNGVQFSYRFGKSDEMNLEYRLKFAQGFEFVKGGKLPGLCGGDCPSGGESADNGWSARYMWRVRNIDNQDRVLGEAYLYHPDKPGSYGEDIYFDNRQFEFETGRWYTLRQYVKMNTPGEYDGVLKVWVDGDLVVSKSGMRFRHSSSVGIDHMNFSTFFGGGDNSWAPSSDQYAYFDDFRIYSGDAGGGPTVGSGGLLDAFTYGVHRNNLRGVWYDFDDFNSGGASAVTLDSAASGASDGGLALRISYTLDQGTYEYDPYVGVGTYLDSAKAPVDISDASGMRFWYKGGSANTIIRIETADIAATERQAYHRVTLPAAAAWTEHTVSWDEFAQPAWSGVVPMDLDLTQVVKISWQVKGNRNASGPESGELLLDNVALPGMDIPGGADPGGDPGGEDPGGNDPGGEDPGNQNPGEDQFVLEDFSDLLNRTLMGGVWYDFDDNNNMGASTIAFAPEQGGYSGGQSAHATYTLDKGDYAYDPFVGVGAYLKEDKTAFNLTSSTGISFWYKGGSDNMVLRIETNEVAATEKMAYHRVSLPPAETWTLFEASWDEFVQPSWSGVTPVDLNLADVIKLSWQIKGDRNAASAQSGEFWLDEVIIVGMSEPQGTALRCALSSGSGALPAVYRSRSHIVVSLAAPATSRITMRLYNAVGRPLREAAIAAGNRRAVIAVDGLAPGMHFVRLRSENSYRTLRFYNVSQ